MNILFTSAGRRGYLLEFFRTELSSSDRLIAVDNDPYASALAYADTSYIAPPIFDRGYLPLLLTICREEQIALLIPLNDLELELLADNAEAFAALGTRLLLPSKRVVAICMDKLLTNQYLAAHQILTPLTFTSLWAAESALADGSLHFPLILKPRWGAGSIAIEQVNDLEELRLAFPLLQRKVARSILAPLAQSPDSLLIQEKIVGREFGVDLISNLEGRFQTALVKEKLSMRAGETDKARIIHHPAIEQLAPQLAALLDNPLILDCDLIEHNHALYLIDLNPRFGGGYPFSHAAGLNLPRAILRWLGGDNYTLDTPITFGALFAKQDQLIHIH